MAADVPPTAKRAAIPIARNPNRAYPGWMNPMAAGPNPGGSVPLPFASHPGVAIARGRRGRIAGDGWWQSTGLHRSGRGRASGVNHVIHHAVADAGIAQMNNVRRGQMINGVSILNLRDDDIVAHMGVGQRFYISQRKSSLRLGGSLRGGIVVILGGTIRAFAAGQNHHGSGSSNRDGVKFIHQSFRHKRIVPVSKKSNEAASVAQKANKSLNLWLTVNPHLSIFSQIINHGDAAANFRAANASREPHWQGHRRVDPGDCRDVCLVHSVVRFSDYHYRPGAFQQRPEVHQRGNGPGRPDLEHYRPGTHDFKRRLWGLPRSHGAIVPSPGARSINFLRPRVGGIVGFLQSFGADVRVNLGRRQMGVAE